MKNVKVILYTKPNGRIPVDEYLRSLDPELQAKFLHTIELLETMGRDLSEPLIRSIRGDKRFRDLMEIKVKHERILFKFYGNEAVLFNGFTKKSRRTPDRELEKARKYRLDYERRF